MDTRQLSRLDLNLLVALQVLLEERSVSNAAERLHISQSAMSKTLARLRELFDDPLFTRSAQGMLPSPRAEALAIKLPKILTDMNSLVMPDAFDPATYKGEFSISLPEYIDLWALPLIFKRLNALAPGIRIDAVSRHDNQLERLANGELDFTIHIEHLSYPSHIRVHTLGLAQPRLFARKGHPLAGKPVNWDDVAQFPQINLHIPERQDGQALANHADSPFFKLRQAGEAALTTDHLFTALQVVRSTDFIFAGPPIFVELQDLSRDIITLDIPDTDDLSFCFVIANHERLNDSPPHQFIYELILDAVREWRLQHELPDFDEMRRLYNLER